MSKRTATPPPPKDPAPQAPTDEPISPTGVAAATPAGRKTPRARKRVMGEGEGDYCIYEIVGAGSEMPRGSLLPIPEVPRFVDTKEAVRWITAESGDQLAGKQVMIFKACEILSLVLQTRPQVVIQAKPKVAVEKPKEAERSDG